jgi:hypothetical protein
MPFEPVHGTRAVRDSETGVTVRVGQASADMTELRVLVEGSIAERLRFSVRRMPGAGGEDGCGVVIDSLGMDSMFRAHKMLDVAYNTSLLAKIIEGIAAFNQHWPFTHALKICSNYHDVVSKGHALSFSMPPNFPIGAIE